MPKMGIPADPPVVTNLDQEETDKIQEAAARKLYKEYEKAFKIADRTLGSLVKETQPSIKAMSEFTKAVKSLTRKSKEVEYELGNNKKATILEGLRHGKRGAITRDAQGRFTRIPGISHSAVKQGFLESIGNQYSGRIWGQKARDFLTKKGDRERVRIEKVSKKFRSGSARIYEKWQGEDITAANKIHQGEKKFEDWKVKFTQSSDVQRQKAIQSGANQLSRIYATWGQQALQADPRYQFNQLRGSIAQRYLIRQDMSAGQAMSRWNALRNGPGPGGGGRGGGMGRGAGGWGGGGKGGRLILNLLEGWGAMSAWGALGSTLEGGLEDREAIGQAGRMAGIRPDNMLRRFGGWDRGAADYVLDENIAKLGFPTYEAIAKVIQAYGSPIGMEGAFVGSAILANSKFGGFAGPTDYSNTLGRMQAMGITTNNVESLAAAKRMGGSFGTAYNAGLPPKQFFENLNDFMQAAATNGIVISDESLNKLALGGANSNIPTVRMGVGAREAMGMYQGLAGNLLSSPLANTGMTSFFISKFGTATPSAEQMIKFFGSNPGYGVNLSNWTAAGRKDYDIHKNLGPFNALKTMRGLGVNTSAFMEKALAERMSASGIDPAWLGYALPSSTAIDQWRMHEMGFSAGGRAPGALPLPRGIDAAHLSKITGESVASIKARYAEELRKDNLDLIKREAAGALRSGGEAFGVVGIGSERIGDLRASAASLNSVMREVRDDFTFLAKGFTDLNTAMAKFMSTLGHKHVP
jgi:hypothetical protein